MATDPSTSVPSAFDWQRLWTPLAFSIALIGVVGSLYMSLGMELKACPLCFYQRAFIMAVAAVLGFGLCMPDIPRGALTPLALASAMAGGCIAMTHTYLVASGAMECPAGASGFLPAPYESLAAFAILLALLLVDLFHVRRYVLLGIGAVLIGYVFASTIMRAKPGELPSPAGDLDGCRKILGDKK